MNTWYVDGKFVPEDEVFVSAKDLTVLRGFGVFDFLRTYHRKPFYLMEHVERFFNSAAVIGLSIPMTPQEVADIVLQTMEKNPQLTEANIRFVFTGGPSPDNTLPVANAGKLMVMVSPKHDCPAEWYTKGVKVITVNQKRNFPTAKSIDYIGAIQAQVAAKKVGAIEALYLDEENHILEATTCNFFAVKNGKIITPKDGILSGITRMAVLNILEGKMEVDIRQIDKSELSSFDEIFITASNKEIVPVVQVDDLTIGNGQVGAVTKQIRQWFDAYTDEYGRK